MPRFFLHIKQGAHLIRDDEGAILPSAEDARMEAVAAAREICANAIKRGGSLEADAIVITDDEDRWVMFVPVSAALPAQVRPHQPSQPALQQRLDILARQTTDLIGHEPAERALRASGAPLVAMLDQMPIGVGLMDRNGTWIMVNGTMRRFVPQRIPSRDPQRMQRWRGFDADGRPLDPSRWPGARALQGETVSPGLDFVYTTDDGREVWARVAAAPFRNADGRMAGAIAVVENMKILAGDAAGSAPSSSAESIFPSPRRR